MITYSDTKDFTEKELSELFLSVDWSSGHFPEKLRRAIQNYGSVFSARDDGKLVGMICTMDDGVMTAYIHYLLVRPDYQKHGIGRALIDAVKQCYKGYLRVLLVAYDDGVHFYEAQGFARGAGKQVMEITELWT